MKSNILIFFLLTLFTGLSIEIDSSITFFTQKNKQAFSVVFTRTICRHYGVHIGCRNVSKGVGCIEHFGTKMSMTLTTLCLFEGMFLIALINRFVQTVEKPHENHSLR